MSRASKPAALILDVSALGAEGWRISHDLRTNEDTAELPILVLTTGQDQYAAATLGANASVAKPFEPSSLLRVLEQQVLHLPGEPARVLIVDDEPKSRELLDTILRSAGVLLVLAANGKQALETLARSPIAAAVVDLMMPEMSGFELILRIRQNPAFT